jgi:hypothetical protein
LKEKVATPVQKFEITAVGDPPRWLRYTPLSANVYTNFADKRESFCRYSSLADSGHGVFCFALVADINFCFLYDEQRNGIINQIHGIIKNRGDAHMSASCLVV